MGGDAPNAAGPSEAPAETETSSARCSIRLVSGISVIVDCCLLHTGIAAVHVEDIATVEPVSPVARGEA